MDRFIHDCVMPTLGGLMFGTGIGDLREIVWNLRSLFGTFLHVLWEGLLALEDSWSFVMLSLSFG